MVRQLPMEREEFEARLKTALSLEIPYFERPLDREGRAAAVLLLIGWNEAEPFVLLTLRTESVETHKGQIAFPGGVMDPEDADAVAAALRETVEEVGVPQSVVRVIGELPKFWTITGFWITPIVGILQTPIDSTPLQISPDEIAETFWVPLRQLVAPGTYHEEQYPVGDRTYPIHVFQVSEKRVWGATGAMLKNFLDRLNALG